MTRTNQLLVIALDGLSLEQLGLLSTRLPWFGEMVACGSSVSLDTMPLVSPQAIWSEILTGKAWFESGCVGYAQPTDSIDVVKITTEKDVRISRFLINDTDPLSTVCINLPLLSHSEEIVWLSDGSMPGDVFVAPARLKDQEPFASYRCRPNITSTESLADIRESVKDCIAVERQRLLCALEIVRHHPWRVFFLRLTVFESLSQLLGPNFLADGLSSEQLNDLFSLLREIIASAESAQVCLISTYSHKRCIGRLNLNRILESHGLCKIMDAATADSPHKGRLATLERPGIAPTAVAPQPSLVVDVVNARASFAASPVSGAVYLNSAVRFRHGIVSPASADDLAKTVFSALRSSIVKQLQLDLDIWSSRVVCPPLQRPPNHVMHYRWRSGKLHMTASSLYTALDGRALNPAAPDFMIHTPGVELSDCGQSPFDDGIHSQSTHHPLGFAVFCGSSELANGTIRPTQLNSALEGFLKVDGPGHK